MCEVVDKIKAEGMKKGMEKGRAEGEAIGKAAGILEGKVLGQNQLIKLGKILESHNRQVDFFKALHDKLFLNQLMTEFNIQ